MLNEQESNKDVLNHLSGSDDVKPKFSGDLDNEKTTMEELKAEIGTKKEAINVHSMPGKFVAATKQSTSSGAPSSGNKAKKLILVAIVLILVVIVVIGGIIFFTSQNVDTSDNNQVAVKNENTNTNVNTNQNENLNINTNVNTNVNTNQNENTNTNENIEQPQALDADNDGLSYEEELVFSTNPNLEDTDKDGYKDGQEISSLYNPLLPAQNLESSSLVTKFMNNDYNYSILRPKNWLVKAVADVLDNILILPDSESGETFTILVKDNTNGQTLNEALASMSAELGSPGNYKNYSLSGNPALRSKDDLNVISVRGDYIYVITHSLSSTGDINFATIFDMMLNSFTWLN